MTRRERILCAIGRLIGTPLCPASDVVILARAVAAASRASRDARRAAGVLR